MLLRWLLLVVGLAVIGGTAFSVVGTLIVPRGIDSRISRACERVIDAAFLFGTRPVHRFELRDRILAWQAPFTLLVRLAVWIALLVVGYGLVLLPFVPGPVGDALGQAGSSMFTLGYAVPSSGPATAVDYVAAYTGLIVVGLQIGYLPTLYSAFNRRETRVTLLSSRAGLPTWGPEILARTRWGIIDSDNSQELSALFAAWEDWSAEVAESHATYLTLVRLRSPHALAHWLTSVLAVMDAAAMHLALSPSQEPRIGARQCLRMGFVALNQIALAMRLPIDPDPDPDHPISVTVGEFEAAVAMLRDVGYRMERGTADAWPHFRGWRVNYDTVALAIARAVDAPPALWSGERRWPSEPIPPRRPAARISQETRTQSPPVD